jgi:hypothetical protein
MNFDANTLFAGIFFGMVGVAALKIGRSIASWKTMILGLILILYPYFISGAITTWVIGICLTALLFIWKDPS